MATMLSTPRGSGWTAPRTRVRLTLLQAGQVSGRVPLAEKLHVEDCPHESLWEDGKDVVDPGGRRRSNGLEAALVGGLADFLGEPLSSLAAWGGSDRCGT